MSGGEGFEAERIVRVMFGIIFQVGLGMLVIYLIYLIALAVMKEDSIVESAKDSVHNNSIKENALILDGYESSSRLSKRRFNTVNPHVHNYVPITRAFNRVGGAQFTYSFWMHVQGVSTTHPGIKGKDIILRGDDREYSYEKLEPNPDPLDEDKNVVTETTTDRVIKCPRIRFGNSVDDIVVEFNTHDDINHRVSLVAQEQRNDPTLRHNLMSLMQNKWVLLTFTFEDNVPVDDFENGIVLRMFVNDVLYYTHRVSSSLKYNYGDLYLFPSGEIPGCSIANLQYFNYALGVADVKKMFEKGRPKHRATLEGVSENVGEPLYLSEYNKLDLHNL